MKSGKKRAAEIRARRNQRALKRLRGKTEAPREPHAHLTAPVNEASLAPYKSYGVPKFVERGFYVAVPFRCVGCGAAEIWTATQQKWWYEVAKGYVYSTAKFCRPCRCKEQERRGGARRVHLKGLANKQK
jgi:Probable zinc-ribbon domain